MKALNLNPLLCCLTALALLGCGDGQTPAPQPQPEPTHAPDKPVPEKLAPSYDDIVAPFGKLYARQIGVRDSMPVESDTKVDLIDVGPATPQVLVAGVVARYIRWEISGLNLRPTYPASGFVTLKLTRNQWKAIEGKRIVLRPSKE